MTDAMQIHLQTRGRFTDYGFLGRPPLTRWWLDYRDFTSYERPTIVVISGATGWRVYASGLTSSRRDRVETVIRYAVVLEGTPGDADAATRLVAAWMTDTLASTAPDGARSALDEQFPEDAVERLMTDRSDRACDEVDGLARKAIASLPAHDLLPDTATAPPWVGGMQAATARDAFLAHVAALLRGTPGAALMVNLVGTKAEATPILDRHPEAAILIDDPGGALGGEIVPIEKKKPTPGGPPSDRSRGRPDSQHGSRILLLAAIALGVAAWLLMRSCDRSLVSLTDHRSPDRTSRMAGMRCSRS